MNNFKIFSNAVDNPSQNTIWEFLWITEKSRKILFLSGKNTEQNILNSRLIRHYLSETRGEYEPKLKNKEKSQFRYGN